MKHLPEISQTFYVWMQNTPDSVYGGPAVDTTTAIIETFEQ